MHIYDYIFQNISASALVLATVFLNLAFFLLAARGIRERLFAVALASGTGLAAFFGARLMHALVERRDLLHGHDSLFTRFDGMTFNGSLFFGCLAFYCGLLLFPQKSRLKFWQRAAVLTPISYGLLRIACFLNGCCWGKICKYPWAVKYSESKFNPWLGLPLHPVQLYDAFLSFFVAALLLYVFRSGHSEKKSLPLLYFWLYSIQRFFVEFFRADALRGEDILWGFSTSQIVSLTLFAVSSVLLLGRHGGGPWRRASNTMMLDPIAVQR